MRRRDFLCSGGAALALALAGCSATGGNGGDGDTVGMQNFKFNPKTLTVDAGTTVTFDNDSETDHTVTAYEQKIPADAAYFASGGFETERAARQNLTQGLIKPGETYEHTFEVAGRHEYFCIPHEGTGMKGTIVVE
ncbi:MULTISPECIES: plastocyanin/azurin family copper-binding protein [unclassified Haladaptatus]|uniref:plastocyanin/azurin family copper-binding protein n=1 Tax=unclassified Haladaptatus TaxID=2622732 RepID=UPI0023E8CE0B|nr:MULTISPECIES: plastocyanin/azurin family copper-binding protein [unclassified Haladaptatus]